MNLELSESAGDDVSGPAGVINAKLPQERLDTAYKLASLVEIRKTQAAAPLLSEAILLLRQNVAENPDDFDSRVLLARLLLWIDGLEEAITNCDQVIAAVEFHYLAQHIRGVARLQFGDVDGAISDLWPLHIMNPKHGLLAWNLANALFHAGKLEEGWKVFETSNQIIPNSYPEIPYWVGEDLDNKFIVLTQYNANGGGDDLLYAQIIPEVIAKAAKCYIETEPRSESLYKRSFNDAVVFNIGEIPWRDPGEIDFQVMVPSLATKLRNQAAHFQRPVSYLKADTNDVQKWQIKLDETANGNVKVGICWRSLISIGLTGPFSSPIEAWGEVFAVPGVTFFELQYDESEDERLAAEKNFKINLHRIAGVDLMQDFDQIAAISHAMDIVISAVTTVDIIANSVGANVWELRPDPTALCMSGLPWFQSRKIFTRSFDQSWEQVLDGVAAELRRFVSEKNAFQV